MLRQPLHHLFERVSYFQSGLVGVVGRRDFLAQPFLDCRVTFVECAQPFMDDVALVDVVAGGDPFLPRSTISVGRVMLS